MTFTTSVHSEFTSRSPIAKRTRPFAFFSYKCPSCIGLSEIVAQIEDYLSAH